MSDTAKPALLVVENDDRALERVAGELDRRFGADYRVVRRSSPDAALAVLEELCAAGEEVAVVLAGQWLSGLDGHELLARAGDVVPSAKRGLLVDWGAWADRPTAAAILRAMALGHIDYYVLRPSRSPDEYFYRTVSEFIQEWSRTRPHAGQEVCVVGERWAPHSHEVHGLLARSGFAHALFERHDPGEVAEMLNAYFDVAIPPVVRREGGDIDRIIGDALMATFNRRGDQPDHAERAARAALALQDATGEIAARHPNWPRFRVGSTPARPWSACWAPRAGGPIPRSETR